MSDCERRRFLREEKGPEMTILALFMVVGFMAESRAYMTWTPAGARVSSSARFANNVDLFSSDSPPKPAVPSDLQSLIGGAQVSSTSMAEDIRDEAARLRKEASDMEVAMREEARDRGLSEEMINKLIPLRATPAKKADESSSSSTTMLEKPVKIAATASDIRSKLGYLPVGDAVKMTSSLDRFKAKGLVSLWNSKDVSKESFLCSNSMLKSKTQIDAVKLKLDDVGYNYQNVFIVALGLGTFFALGSSFIGEFSRQVHRLQSNRSKRERTFDDGQVERSASFSATPLHYFPFF